MSVLTLSEYAAAEAAAISRLPNRVIEQVSAVVFDRIGYPTRVKEEKSVSRYVDVMHEGRAEGDLRDLLGGLTTEEHDLACRINTLLGRMTERMFGQRRLATGSLVRALNVFRHLRFLYPAGPITVLEVGPGSGYLGALLLITGNRYISTDITQPLYIFQNLLWNEVCPGRVHELATTDGDIADLLSADGPVAIHVPWWKYLTLFKSEIRFKVDVVTANHVLCEMAQGGRVYTIKLARQLLQGSNTPSFAFEGWGYQHTPRLFVLQEFARNGFAMTFNDSAFTILEPQEGPVKEPRLHRRSLRALARIAFAPVLPEVKRLQLIATSPRTAIRHHRFMYNQGSRLARSVIEGRKSLVRSKASAPDVLKEFADAAGVPSVETPDEEFCRFACVS